MISSARILIVSPGNPCRNPRPVKEADTLGRAGFDVTLLTPQDDVGLAGEDKTLCMAAPFRHETVKPIRRSLQRYLTWLARRMVPLGIESIGSLGASAALLQRVRIHNSDLTIVHNEIPHWIGVRLLHEGRRIAADLEDWHSEDLRPTDRRHRPLRLLRQIERTLLSKAAYTSTTSDALAEGMHARYGGNRPQVITNSFPLQPTPFPRQSNDPPVFFWFSQTIGPGRGLELFLAAWILTRRPSRLVLLGETSRNYESLLLAPLPQNFRDRIAFHPLVPPVELPSLIAAHDIGLALEERHIINRDLTITNKILQYLNAGLAIVASDTAGQREVFSKNPGIGLLIKTQDNAALGRALDELISEPGRLLDCQRTARHLAETHYHWEREGPRLVEIVKEALKKPRGNG